MYESSGFICPLTKQVSGKTFPQKSNKKNSFTIWSIEQAQHLEQPAKEKKYIVSSFSLHNHLLQHILIRHGRNEGSSVVTADQELLVQSSKGKKPRQGS